MFLIVSMTIGSVKKYYLFAVVLIFATIGVVFVFLFAGKQGVDSFDALAQMVLEACKNASHKPSCYDKEIPRRTEDLSLADSFVVTKIVQKWDQNYWYCHVLGHALSARETAKDTTKWKDVVSQCPSGMCSNGCIHGAFQERFRKEAFATPQEAYALVPELREVCEERENWHPTGLEQATCYHALGHLAMYITDADIHTSVDICKQVAIKKDGRDFTQVCFDGVFMQIFQPLEPEDFTLVEGKNPDRDGLYNFCKNFEGKIRASCWSEGWPLFREEIKTPQGLTKFCATFPENIEQNRCYQGMFYVITAQFNFDENKIIPFCAGMPVEHKAECFSQAASRLIETDYSLVEKSIGLCRVAERIEAGEECYQSLINFSTFNFKHGSSQFDALCNALPVPWDTKCSSNKN